MRLLIHKSPEVLSPLGPDALLFRHMVATDTLSEPFTYELEVLSEDHDIKLEQLVGKSVTIGHDLSPGEQTRYFNGLVSRFAYTGQAGRYARYEMELRPWLWFLTRTADSRIFQDKTVPEIIDELFRDYGYTDFELRLSSSFATREYCVQYRETAFNFVSRLMEQEGIYYFFEHERDRHTMILGDSISAHNPCPGYEEVPYFPPENTDRRARDHVFEWSVSQWAQPGAYSLRDFDFELPDPQERLEVRLRKPLPHAAGDLEIYDHPGGYTDVEEGDRYVKLRIEEHQARFERARGAGNAGGLLVGGLWKLVDFPREDQNREYLTLGSVLELESHANETGPSSRKTDCVCRFEALASDRQYRAPTTTPRPIVQGPQTAIVTGPAGQEIWPDKYGRVKVQFHWDRLGKGDEKSSCWMRVSHAWAGKGWGAITIPRIGQEVIVDFLEGDPDRPVVTGRLFNGAAKPPYELPKHASISTMKSKSVGDAGFNELRFEDKAGREQVFLHAQRRMDLRVGGSLYQTAGRNTEILVGGEEKGDLNVRSRNDLNLLVDKSLYFEVKEKLYAKVSGRAIALLENGLRLKVDTDGDLIFTDRLLLTCPNINVLGGHAKVVLNKGLDVETKHLRLESDKITLAVGKNCLIIDKTGITLQGQTVRINDPLKVSPDPVVLPDQLTDHGPQEVMPPLEALPASSGKPGGSGKGGGGGGRRTRGPGTPTDPPVIKRPNLDRPEIDWPVPDPPKPPPEPEPDEMIPFAMRFLESEIKPYMDVSLPKLPLVGKVGVFFWARTLVNVQIWDKHRGEMATHRHRDTVWVDKGIEPGSVKFAVEGRAGWVPFEAPASYTAKDSNLIGLMMIDLVLVRARVINSVTDPKSFKPPIPPKSVEAEHPATMGVITLKGSNFKLVSGSVTKVTP